MDKKIEYSTIMNENEIIYSTVDEQIEKLLSQHLIINNIDFAKEQLGLYGYFNLIKSYRDPYSIPTPDGLKYRSGITFEQITSLYILDKNLRNSVISAMLDLEEHLKAAMLMLFPIHLELMLMII